MLAGAARDLVVRLALLSQETEDGCHRRQADAAVAETGRIEPRLIEVEARRQHVLDPLVQAGHKQASHTRVSHGCELR